ncbi:hypothetical protein BCR41DRAFT_335595 [Lobosporangium transversale]|uniref:Ribosomal protein S11-domain-containing protein n=1 Tax=Lobosporangium transversale TaxID=64571 RepID=A0A1Y2GPU7_9FUNG|nr:hypothetical protein BCR41DRAFT_335595 [Lobosporangium transversale]ORZ18311.1 hypothetical protein BCR41DRAFT_335595 [Lobosporangium transversale]|eukprot:XP_021882106.1 hypothetical protein BCR41DRAFT_335595 [Lobosporangium transversale]
MLSTISRQALRASHVRAMQSVGSIRYYSAGSNDNSNNNNDTNNTENKSESSESLLSILSSTSGTKTTPSSSSPSSDRPSSSSAPMSRGSELILETLSRATNRQQQSLKRSTGFLNSKSGGGLGDFGRHLFSEVQPCSHNIHIHATMNNTIITLSDSNGDPITTQSAGTAGLKKSARAGPEAGYQAMMKVIEKVEEKNVQILSLHVLMKGFGPGRDSAFKAIRAKTNWDIKRISDTTPIPFNGCRPPKARRL